MSNIQKQELTDSFLLDVVLDILHSQKLLDLSVFKGDISIPYGNVIIGTATSNAQMNGVVKKLMDLFDTRNLRVEGKDSTWMLIEVKEILIHILNEDAREFYMLEDLYFDCELIYQYG